MNAFNNYNFNGLGAQPFQILPPSPLSPLPVMIPTGLVIITNQEAFEMNPATHVFIRLRNAEDTLNVFVSCRLDMQQGPSIWIFNLPLEGEGYWLGANVAGLRQEFGLIPVEPRFFMAMAWIAGFNAAMATIARADGGSNAALGARPPLANQDLADTQNAGSSNERTFGDIPDASATDREEGPAADAEESEEATGLAIQEVVPAEEDSQAQRVEEVVEEAVQPVAPVFRGGTFYNPRGPVPLREKGWSFTPQTIESSRPASPAPGTSDDAPSSTPLTTTVTSTSSMAAPSSPDRQTPSTSGFSMRRSESPAVEPELNLFPLADSNGSGAQASDALPVSKVTRKQQSRTEKRRKALLSDLLTEQAEKFCYGKKMMLYDRAVGGLHQEVLRHQDFTIEVFQALAKDAGEQITKEEAKQRRKVFSEVRRQQIGLSLIKTKEKETKEKETKDKSRSAQTKSKMTRKRNARETFQYDESEASDVEEDYVSLVNRTFKKRKDDEGPDAGAGAGVGMEIAF